MDRAEFAKKLYKACEEYWMKVPPTGGSRTLAFTCAERQGLTESLYSLSPIVEAIRLSHRETSAFEAIGLFEAAWEYYIEKTSGRATVQEDIGDAHEV